jgi:hypothetical protein
MSATSVDFSCHRLLHHRIRVERGHLQGEPKILLHPVGYGVEIGHARAELAQCHVLDLLRPDGGETGDRAGADCDASQTQCGSAANAAAMFDRHGRRSPLGSEPRWANVCKATLPQMDNRRASADRFVRG